MNPPGPVLVTGAAGFIGSHTVDVLLQAGCAVIGVDNFRTGKPENLDSARAAVRAFTFIAADVAEPGVLQAIAAERRPAALIHLAALVSVPESIANPELNFRLNLQATHLAAEAARQAGIPRLVFASSAATYEPVSPYGAAKLASEYLLVSYAHSYGLTVRCQRYFNVYGPRQDPSSPYSGVISIFASRLRQQQAPSIFGDGEQTRDFVSVRDVARANLLAALTPQLRSGVADICTGRPTSLNAVYNLLARGRPSAPAPTYLAPRPGDIRHSRGNPTAAAADLGLIAQVELADGLAELAPVRALF
jgi:UDP-glucose 4-epimerase